MLLLLVVVVCCYVMLLCVLLWCVVMRVVGLLLHGVACWLSVVFCCVVCVADC